MTCLFRLPGVGARRLLAFFLIALLLPGARAAPPALVVVLLPGTSLRDWRGEGGPRLHALMRTGALAVMNTRTAHRPGDHAPETPESALLTLAAGARAASGPAIQGDSLRRAWPAAEKESQRVGYDLRLGNLAETLAAHGVRTEAGGGPDADWVAAGSSGAVTHAASLTAAPGVCLIWDAGSSVTAADTAVGRATAQAGAAHGRLFVLSPYARAADYAEEERLTPVLVWGPGVPAGLLSSPTTRRPGLVANTDFAPAVAAEFGITRRAFAVLPFGYPWSVVPAAGSARRVGTLADQSVQQAQGMKLLPYLALAVGLWVLTATAWILRRRASGLAALTPAAAVSTALVSVSAASFCLALPLGLVLAWTLERLLSVRRVLLLLAAGVTLIVTADMVTGGPLMRRSLLGYSAIEGARYYGVGNEAMGLLIGAALVTAARLWPAGARGRWIGAVLLACLSLLLGTVGAKAGGLLVSAAAFGTFAFAASGGRWSGRAGLGLCFLVLAAMALAAAGDAFPRSGAHSHIGEAVRRILAGGGGEATDIIRRKLAVEGRLAYRSAWAVPLWVGAACTGALWRRQPSVSAGERGLRQGGAVGFCTCLALNDAGVVAAALLTVLLWGDAATKINPRRQTGSAAGGEAG